MIDTDDIVTISMIYGINIDDIVSISMISYYMLTVAVKVFHI